MAIQDKVEVNQHLPTKMRWLSLRESWQSRKALTERVVSERCTSLAIGAALFCFAGVQRAFWDMIL